MNIKIEIKDKELRESLNRIQNLFRNPERVMHSIGMELLSRWRLNWKEEKDPYGKKWARLSEITISRRKKSDRVQILKDTGRLLNSYSVRAFRDSVEIGTNVIYAKTHQFGAKKGEYGYGKKRKFPIPWGNIPARKMLPDLGLTSEDFEIISRKFSEAIERAINA